MDIEEPTGWVDLDRYPDAIAAIEAEMREQMPWLAQKIWDDMKKEQG